MKANTTKITGVLHQSKSAQQYHLRRYFPDDALKDLIEQFWFVDWDLPKDTLHTQQNLPDLNFHLVFENKQLRVLGPVSKTYSYTMENKGSIIGVKFELGALTTLLNDTPANCIDKTLEVNDVFSFDASKLIDDLINCTSDADCVETLQSYLQPYVVTPSPSALRVRQLVSVIKNETSIAKVEELSVHTNLSVRAIQRCFQEQLGVSPKWLIRKYRLHRALELLENKESDIADLVEWLGYTDQSHLIRDFKDVIGVTPNKYIKS